MSTIVFQDLPQSTVNEYLRNENNKCQICFERSDKEWVGHPNPSTNGRELTHFFHRNCIKDNLRHPTCYLCVPSRRATINPNFAERIQSLRIRSANFVDKLVPVTQGVFALGSSILSFSIGYFLSRLLIEEFPHITSRAASYFASDFPLMNTAMYYLNISAIAVSVCFLTVKMREQPLKAALFNVSAYLAQKMAADTISKFNIRSLLFAGINPPIVAIVHVGTFMFLNAFHQHAVAKAIKFCANIIRPSN